MSRPTWDPARLQVHFTYGAFTLFGWTFQTILLCTCNATLRSRNPIPQAEWFSLFRVRSPLLTESQLIYAPQDTEMFHFSWCRPVHLCIQCTVAGQTPAGLPHSEIPGSKCAYHSPRLIAINYVLHRLLSPRHPSCARIRLTGSKPSFSVVVVFLPRLCNCQRTISTRRRSPVRRKPRRQIVWTRAFGAWPVGGRAWNRTRDLVLIRDAL